MKNASFSLVELMVVGAIIAILAGVAIPSYKNYKARANIVEAINFASQWEQKAMDYYNAKGTLPSGCPGSNEFADRWTPTNNIDLLRWCNSEVQIWLRNINQEVDGRMVILQSNMANETFKWGCVTFSTPGAWRMPCKYLPSTCKTNCGSTS